MIKAVIFDLDGTLIHSEFSYMKDILEKTLKHFNITADERKIKQFWFGMNRSTIIENEFQIKPEKFWEVFTLMDNPQERALNSKEYSDINYIKKLKEYGYQTRILTNSPERIALAELKKINCSFDSVVIANPESRINRKPEPDGVYRILELLNIEKNEAIFVGNGEEDILCAENAGIEGVLIDRKEFDNSHIKAKKRINSLYELDSITLSLIKKEKNKYRQIEEYNI